MWDGAVVMRSGSARLNAERQRDASQILLTDTSNSLGQNLSHLPNVTSFMSFERRSRPFSNPKLLFVVPWFVTKRNHPLSGQVSLFVDFKGSAQNWPQTFTESAVPSTCVSDAITQVTKVRRVQELGMQLQAFRSQA